MSNDTTAKPKNWFAKHKVLSGILGLILIIILANAFWGGGDSTSTSGQKNEATPEVTNKIGDAVTVGYFTFTVDKAEQKASVGGQYSSSTASGIYQLVFVTALNNDKEPRYVDSNMFKLVDSQGREFTTSTEATTSYTLSQGGKWDFFLKQLNPGLEQEGALIFDIPKDATGLKLEVKGGFGSSKKAYIQL